MNDLAIQQSLLLPVLRPNLAPFLLDPLYPLVRLALDMNINDTFPLFTRGRAVDKDDLAAFGMNSLCKLLDEVFEAMHLERGAHDEQKVGLAGNIIHLQLANLVAKRVRFVVQHN